MMVEDLKENLQKPSFDSAFDPQLYSDHRSDMPETS